MSISFGAEKEFRSATTSEIRTVALSSTTFVVVYVNGTPGYDGACRVGTISGGAVTFGAAATFSAGADHVDVAALSSTQFVVAWREYTGGAGNARVGTVAGGVITLGATAQFVTGITPAFQIRAAGLTSTTFVVVYNSINARVGTVAGDAITYGDASASISGFESGAAAKLSSTTFVVALYAGSTSNCRIGTVSGTTVTIGAAKNFSSGSYTYFFAFAVMSSTQFVLAYTKSYDSWNATAKVATVSGTDITYGAEVEFLSANGVIDLIGAAALSSTLMVVLYRDASDANHGTAKLGTVSGTGITWGAEAEFLAANGASYISASKLDASGNFVVAYQDGSDASHGTVKIGTESTLAAGAAWTATPSDSAPLADAQTASAISVRADSASLSDGASTYVRNPVNIKLGLGLGEGP